MTAITQAKKRTDQSASEKKQIKLIKELLRVMGEEWGKIEPCGEFCMDCKSCQHYLFLGMLNDYKSDLEY